MATKDLKSVTKSFRLTDFLSEELDKIKSIKNISFQQIVTDALAEYAKNFLQNNADTIKTIKKIDENINIEEYMYIPIDYYSKYNDMSKFEVLRLVKTNHLKSIVIADVTLIMIDVNEKIFEKAELLTLKHNVSVTMKEMYNLKKEFREIKRKLLQGEEKGLEKIPKSIEPQ